MWLINMKELLSYWDLSLGIMAIVLGVLKWYRLEIYKKERDDKILREGNWVFSKNDSFEYTICMLFIVLGIIFIYNRLKGNLPNIVILLKELSTY